MIVLALSAIILMLGSVYIKNYTDSSPATKLQIDRIQADFFAKGIQNIALFKIRKYQDFFLKAYRQYIYGKRAMTDNTLVKLSAEQENQQPFESFLGTQNGNYVGLFNNYMDNSFISPLKIATYSVDISLLNSLDFQNESIAVTVYVKLQGDEKPINKYKVVVACNYKEVASE